MFRSMIIVLGTVTVFAGSAKAETPDTNILESQQIIASVVPERSMGYVNELNVTATRNFRMSFNDVTGEKWSKKKDGFRVSFIKDDIRYLVDYDRKGRWSSTIRIYDEHQLPENIRRAVKTNYLDYSIVTVTELKINKVLSYFVKLEDATTLKTIRIINDEMEEVEDYVK